MKKMLLALVAMMTAFCGSAFAALDATQLTDITTGISGADANYYAIGGTVLVVLAGIWGFKLVKALIR
jgi:hypothetical protein